MLVPGTQQIRSFHGTFSKTINADYLLYLPKDYETQQQKHWPLILFLHGAGERGEDVNRVKSQGLAITYPHRFAAIAPICGGGNPTRVCAIKHVPVWTFHGAKDDIVPLDRSKEMVEALKKCGGHVRFTIYPEAHHDSWTQTYANPQLYDWLLECTRTGA